MTATPHHQHVRRDLRHHDLQTTIGTLTGGSPAGNSYTLDGTGAGNGTDNAVGNLASGSTATAVINSNTSVWAIAGNATYTGTTTVNGGTLLFNGNGSTATGTVTANSGGTLGGTGTVGGATTVASGGTIAPGTATGAGVLTLARALKLATAICPPAHCLTGGGLVAPIDAAPAVGSTTYELFQFSAPNAGGFPSVQIAGLFDLALADAAGVWTPALTTAAATRSRSTRRPATSPCWPPPPRPPACSCSV